MVGKPQQRGGATWSDKKEQAWLASLLFGEMLPSSGQSRESSIILDISTERRRWGTSWVRWLFGGIGFSQILLSYLMFVLLGLDRAYLSMDCRNTLPSSSVLLYCIVEWPRKAALEVLRIQGAGVLPTILCCLAISATSNPPPDQPPLSLSTVPLQFCILQPAGVGIYLLSSLLLGLAKGYMKSLWCCMVHRKIFDLLIVWGNIARGTTDTI